MTTRCKVRCVGVEKVEHWSEKGVFLWGASFSAVFSDTPENKAFFAATPSLTLKVSTVRSDHFEVGREYYLDFTEAS